jgi:hypothetical protein
MNIFFNFLFSLLLLLVVASCSDAANKTGDSLLKKYPKYVEKVPYGYKIYCKNGKVRILKNLLFRDDIKLPDDKIRIISGVDSKDYNEDEIIAVKHVDGIKEYSLDSYFSDIGYIGFKTGYYEGTFYEMVSLKSCDIFNLVSKPHISPDEKIMISAMYNEVDDYGRINIFNITSEKLEKTFYELPIYFDSWIDSNSARFLGFHDKNLEYFINYDKSSNKWTLLQENNQ